MFSFGMLQAMLLALFLPLFTLADGQHVTHPHPFHAGESFVYQTQHTGHNFIEWLAEDEVEEDSEEDDHDDQTSIQIIASAFSYFFRSQKDYVVFRTLQSNYSVGSLNTIPAYITFRNIRI